LLNKLNIEYFIMENILNISIYGFAYMNRFENGKLKIENLLALYCSENGAHV